jgi:hypothetical protein
MSRFMCTMVASRSTKDRLNNNCYNFWQPRDDRVVPFRMEGVAADGEAFHLGVADLDAFLVDPCIECSLDFERGLDVFAAISSMTVARPCAASRANSA